MSTEAQTARILRHLESGRSLSALIALERFGCMRLAARILELRERGLRIQTHMVRFGNKRWASYLMDRA